MLGAALGGAMADLLGWRWEFGIQVPPLIICVVIAVVAIPSDLGLADTKEDIWTALRAFDFRGSFLLTVAITFFVLGLVRILAVPLVPALCFLLFWMLICPFSSRISEATSFHVSHELNWLMLMPRAANELS
jgi:hypothetical protein